MPRIPLLNETARRTPDGPRADILAQETLAIGGAVQAATGAASKFLNKLQESQDASDLSSALAFSAEARSENINAIKDGGFVGADERFTDGEKKIEAEVKKQWPRAVSAWSKNDTNHASVAQVKLRSWQSKQQIAAQKADLVTIERVWKDEAIRALDDVSLGVSTANYFKALDSAVAAGTVNEFDAAKRKEKFAITVTSARIDRDIDANPAVTLEKLEKGGYAISEDKKLAKIKSARNQVEVARQEETRRLERLDELSEKNLKEDREDRAIEYTALMAEGNPVDRQQAVSDLRNKKISRKFFDSIMAEQSTTSNQDELLDVDDRILRGAITREGILSNPLITPADKSIRLKALALAEDKDTQRKLRDGVQELQAVIISTGPAAKFLAAGESERLEKAKNELATRISDGEGLREILDDMTPRFRTNETTINSLPIPRGHTARPKTTTELTEIKRELVKNINSGAITDVRKAEEEAELLAAYQEVITRLEAKRNAR